MRVLVVHNRYSSRVPSGENLAVDDEVGWLRDAGVDVHLHQVSNDDVFGAGPVHKIRQAAESLWSLSAQREVAATIARVEPDLVHVHNLFPLLSASVPWAASRRVPVVWTVHNHRLTCVIGTNFRDDRPCYDCRPGWRVPGIRHACYGSSVAGSALVTGATSLYRRMARRRFTALAISEHVGRWLRDTAGYPPERVRVKYDAVAGPDTASALPPAESRRVFLFAGYVIDWKGVSLLLDAWSRADLPDDVELRVVGDGPMLDAVRSAADADGRIVATGHVAPAEVARHLADARAVVVPSTWDEPFGRSAAEALAFGRPVITTGFGGLGEIVDSETGWVTGADPAVLARTLERVMRDDLSVANRAAAGLVRHAKLFSPTATTGQLVQIYEDELARS